MMRDQGYDVEDCLTYDMLTEEQKMERKLHPEKHGVEAYIFKQEKQKEQDLKLKSLSAEATSIEKNISDSRSELSDIKNELEVKKNEKINVDQSLNDTRRQIGDLQKKDADLQRKISEAEMKKTSYEAMENLAAESKHYYEEKFLILTHAPSIASYEAVIKENTSLKSELSLKDGIIQSLSEKCQKLSDTLEAFKKAFQTISLRAGSKLMALFGYDVSNDTSVMPYPDKKVSEGISSMYSPLTQDPHRYLIITDPQHNNMFRIAFKDNDGSYQTIYDSIPTREEADRIRRNLSDASLGFNHEDLNIKITMKDGINA